LFPAENWHTANVIHSTWLVNTGLTPLEPEECTTKPIKMSKSLQQAYAIAAEGHDLDFYKQVLADFQEESARLEAEAQTKKEEAETKAAAKAEKDAKAKDGEAKDKKKKSRKSKAADEDDIEMEDAEAPKSSKKRKKDADSDGEGPKVCIPVVSPKTTTLTNL
jgi:cobalamin biosynthesis protein CobT